MNSLFLKYALKEQQKTEYRDINILLLSTSNNKDSWTINKILGWCEKNNVRSYIGYTKECKLEKDNERFKIISPIDEFEISPNNTIVILRDRTNTDLINSLNRYKFNILNNNNIDFSLYDKYLIFKDNNFPCLKTKLILKDEKIDINYPINIISKDDIFTARSEDHLIDIKSLLFKDNDYLILQEYVDVSYSLKIQVLNNLILSSVRINSTGTYEEVSINEEIKNTCISIANIFKYKWCDVEIIFDKNKKYYLKDISPISSIYQGLKHDNINEIMQNLISKEQYDFEKVICGYNEIIDIKGIGKAEAKFDTGNGSICNISAKIINKNDKEVYYEFNGIKCNGIINRSINVKNNTSKTPIYNTVTIKLDISLNDKLYDNVEFIVDDKGKTGSVILSRDFIKKANLLIDAGKEFILTKK